MVRRVKQWFEKEVTVRRHTIVAPYIIQAVTLIAVAWITVAFVNFRGDQAEAKVADARYTVAVHDYEASVKDETDCKNRVGTRDVLRVAFAGIYSTLDGVFDVAQELSPDAAKAAKAMQPFRDDLEKRRQSTDDAYPSIDPGTCPVALPLPQRADF